MKFCPKCGSLMKKENNYLVCPNCGYKEKIKDANSLLLTENINKSSEITIMEEDYKLYPIDNEVECPNVEIRVHISGLFKQELEMKVKQNFIDV